MPPATSAPAWSYPAPSRCNACLTASARCAGRGAKWSVARVVLLSITLGRRIVVLHACRMQCNFMHPEDDVARL